MNIKNLNLEHLYLNFVADIKSKYQSVQLKASCRINTKLIQFYWQLDKDIIEKQIIALHEVINY